MEIVTFVLRNHGFIRLFFPYWGPPTGPPPYRGVLGAHCLGWLPCLSLRRTLPHSAGFGLRPSGSAWLGLGLAGFP